VGIASLRCRFTSLSFHSAIASWDNRGAGDNIGALRAISLRGVKEERFVGIASLLCRFTPLSLRGIKEERGIS
jgi:hypothetical protein